MRVLAFMQNMWVREPERLEAMIAKYGERYRRKAIPMFLFAGCVSGRRIRAAFGDLLCGQIVWEEASRTITGSPREAPPADPAHIASAIKEHAPDVVLCFGRIAADAVRPLWNGHLVIAPHPAARHPDTIERLKQAAKAITMLGANP